MSQELLNIKYDTFKQQPTNVKLDTLFVKIEDMRECYNDKIEKVGNTGKWNKAYAAFGGAAAGIIVICGKAATWFFWGK